MSFQLSSRLGLYSVTLHMWSNMGVLHWPTQVTFIIMDPCTIYKGCLSVTFLEADSNFGMISFWCNPHIFELGTNTYHVRTHARGKENLWQVDRTGLQKQDTGTFAMFKTLPLVDGVNAGSRGGPSHLGDEHLGRKSSKYYNGPLAIPKRLPHPQNIFYLCP